MKYKKMYYNIGQISSMAELPQSVLRYWETVIDALKPLKSAGGTRQYSDSDVELILKIKKLLYDDGFTIKGANKHISEHQTDDQPSVKASNETSASNVIAQNKQGKAAIAGLKEQNVAQTQQRPEKSNQAAFLEHIISELKSILNTLNTNP